MYRDLRKSWENPDDHSIGGILAGIVMMIGVHAISQHGLATWLGGGLGFLGWLGGYRKLDVGDYCAAIMFPILIAWMVVFGIPLMVYEVLTQKHT